MARPLLISPPIIERMIREQQFHTFSFCASPPREPRNTNKKSRVTGCGGCRRRAKRRNRKLPPPPIDYNEIKRQITGLDTAGKTRLKKLLKRDKLKLHYRDRRGQVQKRVI